MIPQALGMKVGTITNYYKSSALSLLIKQVEMKPGVGPVFDKPLETPADIDNLTIPDVKVNTIHSRASSSPFEPERPQIRL